MTVPTVTTAAATNASMAGADSGGSVTANGGKAITDFGVCWSKTSPPTVADAHIGVFNVMDYGAHRDGTTDDAAHIQSAVNACQAAGGGIVYMPPGHYFVHARTDIGGTTWDVNGEPLTGAASMQVNVNVVSGVYVLGAGASETFVTTDLASCSPFGAYDQSNIGVAGFDLTTTAALDDGCKFAYCRNVTVGRVIPHGFYIGAALYGCRDSAISNSSGYDNGTSFVIGEGYEDVQDSDNVRATNCVAYGTTGVGFRIAGYPPGSAHVGRLNNAYLTDCVASGGRGIRTGYAGNLTYLRCTDDGGYKPMVFMNVSSARLTGCTHAYQVTAANDSGDGWYADYGSVDCANIVED